MGTDRASMAPPLQGDIFHAEGGEPGAHHFDVFGRRRGGGGCDAATNAHADRGWRCGGSSRSKSAAPAAAASASGSRQPGPTTATAAHEVPRRADTSQSVCVC